MPSEIVRNLCVVDISLTMHSHITNLCSSLTFQLRNITRIWKVLDFDTCQLMVRALVLSRLDYGNGLLFGSNISDIQRLKRVQNWAAKLICGDTKYEHASPCL